MLKFKKKHLKEENVDIHNQSPEKYTNTTSNISRKNNTEWNTESEIELLVVSSLFCIC